MVESIESICGELYDYRGSLGIQCINFGRGKIESITEKPRGEGLDYTGTGMKIIPGLIDLHVHLRGLQLSYKEDEETGTLQALKAGITLVVDMPNTKPYLNTPEAVRHKLDQLSKYSWTDYSLYSGIPTSREHVDKLAQAPIAGFKTYPGDLAREELIKAAAGAGKLLIVHPELLYGTRMAEYENNRLRGEARGCHLEGASVELLASLGVKGRIHVTHASCPSTVRLARRNGYSVDTTPHHLFYNYHSEGCLYRVNPPLRSPVDSSILRQMLILGEIDALASDHAPHAQWEKSEPLICSPGFPWLPLWPWLAYKHLVASGAMGLDEFLYLTSRGPAEILGLSGYGIIDYGARANLVVLDPNARWRFPGFTDSKHRLPVHFMASLAGRPELVIVGGVASWSYRRGVLKRGATVNPFNGEENDTGVI